MVNIQTSVLAFFFFFKSEFYRDLLKRENFLEVINFVNINSTLKASIFVTLKF